jgi:hypothetical protein
MLSQEDHLGDKTTRPKIPNGSFLRNRVFFGSKGLVSLLKSAPVAYSDSFRQLLPKSLA